MIAVLATALIVTGCGATTGASDSISSSSSVSKDLPSKVRDRGTIEGVSFMKIPPISFTGADGQPTGFDIELGDAAASELGVKMEWTNLDFAGIIPGLLSGRFDVSLSGISVTPEREEQLDFIPYFNTGYGIVATQDIADGVSTLEDLCGMKVAVATGTEQEKMLHAQNKKCSSPMEILGFGSQSDVDLQLKQGRAVATVMGLSSALYLQKQTDGEFEVVGDTIEPSPIGIAFAKGSPLVEPFRKALTNLKEDGTYEKLLEKYGLEKGAVSSFDSTGS
jgi:polar amino acid transport system substrate-binding protein